MLLDDLFIEAKRQLTICNSCRYREGYCPAWPALELRTDLTPGDVSHLANLCHDCRDCFNACMYTALHLNPPKIFAALRTQVYQDYVWPQRIRVFLRGRRGLGFLAVVTLVVVLALPALLHGEASHNLSRSPYRLLPHWVLVGVVSLPVVWGIAMTVFATSRCWRDIQGRIADLGRPIVWAKSLMDGVRLRYMRGGGEECTYPTEEPSRLRRWLHNYMLSGLLLCLLSTISAAIEQEFLGIPPPYPVLSVPVITGTLGSLGAVAGCVGLLWTKRRSDRALTTAGMLRADNGLLFSLLLLSVTGLLTLALRDTGIYTIILCVHVISVVVYFRLAPYTKCMHFVYRLMSIYKFRLEQLDSSAAVGKGGSGLPIPLQ